MKLSYIFSGVFKTTQVSLSLLASLVVARILGTEEFGIYTYAVSLLGIFSTIASCGLPSYVLREVPLIFKSSNKERLTKLISSSLRLIFVASILVLLIGILFSLFYPFLIFGEQETCFLLMVFMVALVTAVNRFYENLSLSFGRIFLSQCGEKIIYPVLIITIVIGVNYFSTLSSLSVFFIVAISITLACFFTVFISKVDLKNIKRNQFNIEKGDDAFGLYKKLKYFHILSVFGIISGQIDIIILGIFSSASEVAVYKVGFTWAALLTFVMTAIDVVIFPKISVLFQGGERAALEMNLKNAAKASFIFASVFFLMLFIFGEGLIEKLYGEDYKKSVQVILILGAGQLVNTFVGSVHGLLNLTGHEKLITKISIIFAILACCIHSYSAQKFGATGVAISNALLIAGINITLFFYAKSRTGIAPSAFP